MPKDREKLTKKWTGSLGMQLLDTFKQVRNYDDTLLEVYGFDTDGLDDLWLKESREAGNR